MSALNQSNGKKGSNISVSNTPVSTPVTNTTNGNSQAATQSTPPPNNAPKYGTLVPNRIFVGGISSNTTEGELLQLFSSYGTVKAAKIIQDRAGVSKGYGFITFESEDDAKRPLRDSETIVLRERKLNIAPAIKKQPFNRGFDGSSPPTVAPGNTQYFFTPPVPFYQGGVAYYNQPPPPAPGDPTAQAATVYQAPPVYPPQTGPPQATTYPGVMFPAQTLYMPQQYPMPIPYEYSYYPSGGAAGPAQYVVSNQGGAQGAPQLQQPPSASSPPRGPACYGSQQLAAYGAPEPTIFYGVPPMYGPMDTASGAVYTDCVDITNGAAYTEEPYMDYKIEPTSTLMIENGPSLIVQPEVIYSPKSTETPADAAAAASQALQPSSQQQQPPESASNIDTTRQSNTPVVSLLSIDHHQEKDYLSMQSGRRRKSNPTLPNMSTYTNGYNTFSNLNMYTAPPPLTYHPGSYQNAFYNGMQPPQPVNAPGPSMNHQEGYRYGKPMVNGYDRSKKRRPFNNDRRNGDSSNRSSMRDDSNSSSSVVDENKNEERKGLPQQKSQTSSSFAYSSNNNNANNNTTSHRINNTGTRSYRNATGRSVYSNASFGDRKMYNNRNINHEQKEPSWPVNVSSSDTNTSLAVRTDSVENSNLIRVSNTVTSSPQVHAAAGNQNFVPPARRNRKSVRKNTGGSSSLNEIGAGDAPLPSQDVGDTCKRMESLKL